MLETTCGSFCYTTINSASRNGLLLHCERATGPRNEMTDLPIPPPSSLCSSINSPPLFLSPLCGRRRVREGTERGDQSEEDVLLAPAPREEGSSRPDLVRPLPLLFSASDSLDYFVFVICEKRHRLIGALASRMAATMRAKMNRRKLDKLDIIKIWCELHLNSSFIQLLRSSAS